MRNWIGIAGAVLFVGGSYAAKGKSGAVTASGLILFVGAGITDILKTSDRYDQL